MLKKENIYDKAFLQGEQYKNKYIKNIFTQEYMDLFFI